MTKTVANMLLAAPFRALILIYRYGISPFTPGSCRFHPSCSAYAEDALRTHGALSADAPSTQTGSNSGSRKRGS